MRRMLSPMLVIATAIALMPQVAPAQQAILVYVDGRLVNFDVPPQVIQGRVFVPLRGVFEHLGATVDYDAHTQHIVAVRGSQTVELTIGSRQARVGDQAKLLDVPAFTINGRTMVPLRFVSESLGASVQWIDASRTILIGSSGGAVTPPPPGPAPQPQSQTITGRLMAVSTGQTPKIVVRTGDGQDHTIGVLPETAIFRYNVENNAGGSAPLGTLRAGDRVVAEVNTQNQATKITATYRLAAAGRIASVNASNRTVTLANGSAYVVLPDAVITVNGQVADFSACQNGRNAQFSVVQGTNQAYEVRVTTPAASTPSPSTVSAPSITAPSNGATVGTTFVVKGKATAGARVVVTAQPRLLGQAAQGQTTAEGNGDWAVNMSVSSIPFVSFPYVISAVQIVSGTQSDAAAIEVTVH